MTLKSKILAILRVAPETRNSDKELIRQYYGRYHKGSVKALDGSLWLNMDDLKDLPSMESVRRTRQKIQNEDGLYQADKEVFHERVDRMVEMRQDGDYKVIEKL